MKRARARIQILIGVLNSRQLGVFGLPHLRRDEDPWLAAGRKFPCKFLLIKAISALRASAFDTLSVKRFKLEVLRDAKQANTLLKFQIIGQVRSFS
jgi:hypothetical protein